MTNTKEVFFQNDLAIQQIDTNLTKVQAILQNIVDACTSSGLKVESIQQIRDMTDQARRLDAAKLHAFAINQLHPDTPAGFNRESYLKMTETPDLTAIVGAFRSLAEPQLSAQWRDVVHWNCYIVTRSKVVIILEAVAAIKAPYQETATTAEELQRLRAVMGVCTLMDALKDMRPDLAPETMSNGIFIWNHLTGKFNPAPEFIKKR